MRADPGGEPWAKINERETCVTNFIPSLLNSRSKAERLSFFDRKHIQLRRPAPKQTYIYSGEKSGPNCWRVKNYFLIGARKSGVKI
jgi:hypothetical protein